MGHAAEFLERFQTGLDQVPLPDRIASAWRLESCLSHGDQGEVWLLSGRENGERAVLKIRPADGIDLEEEHRMLERLPEDLAGQVPRPLDFFREGERQYLLRSYLPGRTLEQVRAEEPDRARQLCVRVGAEMCALLERLHRLEPPVIHRDIKPENIILSPGGTPGLVDFDIARTYQPGRDADTVMMGTRSTAAPEQYGFAQSDPRTDLYALGVTLRWMVTGSYRPDALDGAPCPARLKRLLRRSAAFDPADRFPTAASMGAALTRLMRPRWQRALALALALCLTLCAAFAALWSWRSRTVAFDSPLLEAAVRGELGKPEGALTYEDLQSVRRLAVVGRRVLEEGEDYSYRLCGYVDNVSQLDEPAGDIGDLSLLSHMPGLTVLYLCGQQIDDLTPLAGLPLTELYLCDNRVKDLSPLADIPTLEVLYLGTNPAVDYSPLADLSSLRELNLDSWDFDRRIDSLSPLAGLPIETLSLGNTSPRDGDWSVLGTLGGLETLWLWDPPAEAVEALGACRGLSALHLGNYSFGDLTALPVLPRLTSLFLYSMLPSIEGIGRQEKLTYVGLCDLPDMDLTPLTGLNHLDVLNVFDCGFSDYSPLERISSLRRVEADEAAKAALEETCRQGKFKIVA